MPIQQNVFRRFQQRSYVDLIGSALNPTHDKSSSSSVTVSRSDAILYLEQHLDRIEQYLQAQHAEGINAQHYKNLLLRINKIREKYTKP
jgi:hypothetical protein